MANMVIAAKAQDINFVAKFETNVRQLLAVLSKTSVDVVSPGTAYKTYNVSGTLSDSEVAEKALIPDSGITVTDGDVVEINYKKFRNLTGIEQIGKYGYDISVGKTNGEMIKQIQRKVRKTIFDGLATGTGTATGTTFQKAIANTAAKLAVMFEDENGTPVFFVNPIDLYDYLGDHTVTLESAFGLSYLQNFLGIGNLIADSNVPEKTVYGTVVENLDVIAPSIASIPGLEMTTDESNIIAVHNDGLYENAAVQTVAYCGLVVHPAFKDRIIKTTIGA